MNNKIQKVRVMADIETLSAKPGGVILSIGAVKFDRHGVHDSFYQVITPKSCTDAGLKIDIDTVMWWFNQSPEAQKALLAEPRSDLPQVLLCFAAWVASSYVGVFEEKREVELWGNGANFDNVLLAAAYDACGLDRPWKFYNDRCYRTLKAMHPDVPMARSGTHHNALDDARSQAMHLISLPSFQAMCDREEEAAV